MNGTDFDVWCEGDIPAPTLTQAERAARINALRIERDAVRADRDHAYARCDTMATCGDMRGWQDWLTEALRLADKLEALTAESDALAALCL
jgi:hypothetical protein